MNKFQLKSKFNPTGDQPGAIKKLTEGLIKKKFKEQKTKGNSRQQSETYFYTQQWKPSSTPMDKRSQKITCKK